MSYRNRWWQARPSRYRGFVKLVLTILGLVFVGAITLYKRAQAKKRLAEVDNGERCLACDNTQMERLGPVARCLLCGHKYNVAQMAYVDAGSEAHALAATDTTNSLDTYD